DGSQHGTLGGGCVEAEVKQRALRVLAAGAGGPEVLTFCLDDNYGWDDGLICGGRMSMLVDPLRRPPPGHGADPGNYDRRFPELVEQAAAAPRRWRSPSATACRSAAVTCSTPTAGPRRGSPPARRPRT